MKRAYDHVGPSGSIRRGQRQCANSRALSLDSRSRVEAAQLRCRESADRLAASREITAICSRPRVIALHASGSSAAVERASVDEAQREDAAVIVFPGREPEVLLRQLLWELGEGRTTEITAAAIDRFAGDTTPELRRQVAALRKWLDDSQ